jgi:hypothetical protein
MLFSHLNMSKDMNLVHGYQLQIGLVIKIEIEFGYVFMHIQLLYIVITEKKPITNQHW